MQKNDEILEKFVGLRIFHQIFNNFINCFDSSGWMFRITVFSSTDLVALCAYQRDVTIQYYTNPNPNHKRVLNLGPEFIILIILPRIDAKEDYSRLFVLRLGILD